MKKMILSLLHLLYIFGTGMAQDDTKAKLVQELSQLSTTYSNARYLSFDITYKYSSEEQPALYLDSLKGRFKMNGSNFWCQLDSTEALQTKDYSIVLFMEDQLIYLSKPSAEMGFMNPFALIDSFLIQNKDIRHNLSETKKQKQIELQFPEGQTYKSVTYTIHKRTGFLEKVVCVVRARQLYDPSVQALVEGDVYAVIEINMDNYLSGGFDDAQFRTDRYFKKKGSSYVAVAPYESYTIFLGSAQL